jgi:hypothetical protein
MNGQESDSEISGSWGSHYTAEYWMYDSRLMRRWNLDPKPNPSISQYSCFAGNPIWYSDPLGDTVRARSGDKQAAADLEKALKNKDFKKTYDRLNESDVVYEFRYDGNLETDKEKSGFISTDGNDIFLNYSHKSKSVEQGELSTMFHEFEHGRQFEDGEIGFIKSSSNSWVPDPESYDIMDEVKAMRFGALAPGGDAVIAKRKWGNATKGAKNLKRFGGNSYKAAYNNWVKKGSPINGVNTFVKFSNKHIEGMITVKRNDVFFRTAIQK